MHQYRSDNEAHRALGMARQYQEEYASEEEEDSLQAGPPPGKHTLTESLQRHGDGLQGSQDAGVQAEGRGGEAHTIAEEGLRGDGQPLPYAQKIQRSFGRHELGAVQAHVGGAAGRAAEKLGAEAYAMGSGIGFREAPSLHTAAHEAAHLIQQRSGVSLAGGVGAEGDAYERHADAVADAVVRGESAEALLEQGPSGSGGGGAQRRGSPPGQALAQRFAVQHKHALQLRSARGVSVSDMRFSPREVPADGTTVSQASVQYSGRVLEKAVIKWSLEGASFGSAVNDQGLVTPGTALTPKKDKDLLRVKAVDSKEAGAWTEGKLTLWDPKFLQAKKDYAAFVGATYQVTNFRPNTGGGKFDATYSPAARTLTAQVRMSFNFVNDQPGAAPWLDKDKKGYIRKMVAKVQGAWSGQWQFQNTREPQSIWKKLAPVRVRVQAKEDTGSPHFALTIHKKQGGRSAIQQGTFTGDLHSNDGTNQRNPFPNTGAAELTALQAKTPTPIQFAAGKADIPAADLPKLQFLSTYLHSVRSPTFKLTITGHAQLDGAAVTPADKRRAAGAAKRLSQQRADAIRTVLQTRGVGQHAISVRAKGSDGAAAGPAWDKAEIGSALRPGYQNQQTTYVHEFGHMLGLRDEYTGGGGGATGNPTQHYALTKAALGQDYADSFARVTVDSEGIMQGGSDVRPHHYATLWEALAAATATAAVPAPPFGQADWKFIGV